MVNILRHLNISIAPTRAMPMCTYYSRAYSRHATEPRDEKEEYTWSAKEGLGWRPYSPILFSHMYKHCKNDSSAKHTREHSERNIEPSTPQPNPNNFNSEEKLRAAFHEYLWNKKQKLKRKSEESSKSKAEEASDFTSPSRLEVDADFSKVLNILAEKPYLDEDTLKALTDLIRTQGEFKLNMIELYMDSIRNRSLFPNSRRTTLEVITNLQHSDPDFDSIIAILKNTQMNTPGLVKQLTEILSIRNEYKLKVAQLQAESWKLNKKWIASIIAAMGIVGIYTYKAQAGSQKIHERAERANNNVREVQEEQKGNAEKQKKTNVEEKRWRFF